jgi:hypothetical protein
MTGAHQNGPVSGVLRFSLPAVVVTFVAFELVRWCTWRTSGQRLVLGKVPDCQETSGTKEAVSKIWLAL